MFNLVKPEEKGIASENVMKYVQFLEDLNLTTHDILLVRGEDIFFEKYYPPFHQDYKHRMYSITKSYVSLAIGFLEQDGLICLDDKIEKYFPEETKDLTDENVRNQTLRHMLMMCTARRCQSWMTAKIDDRVQFYFRNFKQASKPSGHLYLYDSTGSFVLCALVERLTGKTLVEYLREKLFDKIGVSEDVTCLKCPGGHSWGDSALICTPRDLLKVARFVLNGGSWNGEQILNREYLQKATTPQADNSVGDTVTVKACGYGYLIWCLPMGGFGFLGMGGQLAVCMPNEDLILIYNGDNQDKGYNSVIEGFIEYIVKPAQNAALPNNPEAYKVLCDYAENLELITVKSTPHSPMEAQINGATYALDYNDMGIENIRFEFNGDEGKMCYTNAQGYKELFFGLGHNTIGTFPQEGYSREIGTVPCPGNYYRCAVSGGWDAPDRLRLKVQIIDIYFGTIDMIFCFEDDKIMIRMEKYAEKFLEEYKGFGGGKKVNN